MTPTVKRISTLSFSDHPTHSASHPVMQGRGHFCIIADHMQLSHLDNSKLRHASTGGELSSPETHLTWDLTAEWRPFRSGLSDISMWAEVNESPAVSCLCGISSQAGYLKTGRMGQWRGVVGRLQQ